MVLKIEEECTTDIENFHTLPMDILIFMAILMVLKDLADGSSPLFSGDRSHGDAQKVSGDRGDNGKLDPGT